VTPVATPVATGRGYAVVCPDGARRHGGLFPTDRAARRWAAQARCCTLAGAHRITYRRGPSLLRRLSAMGWS